MSDRAQPPPAEGPAPYARYRQQIQDPALREALLRQVRDTVLGLRQSYVVHLAAAMLSLLLLLLLSPAGFLGTWREPLIAGLLLADLMALGGLRSVATHPARWIGPLLALDLVLVLGLTVLSAVHGEFSLAWLLLLLFPAMLFVHRRDAHAIEPLLAEYAGWRHRAESPDAK